MKRFPMTAQGAQRLRSELQRLKSEDRPRVIVAIAEARAHGDLKENAEYHAAREQQSFIEGRIRKLEQHIGGADVVEPASVNAGGRVVFGATVELSNVETGDEVRYQIVGDLEADIAQLRISISSPIARALIGKEEGDIALVNAPSGEIEYDHFGRVRVIRTGQSWGSASR